MMTACLKCQAENFQAAAALTCSSFGRDCHLAAVFLCLGGLQDSCRVENGIAAVMLFVAASPFAANSRDVAIETPANMLLLGYSAACSCSHSWSEVPADFRSWHLHQPSLSQHNFCLLICLHLQHVLQHLLPSLPRPLPSLCWTAGGC